MTTLFDLLPYSARLKKYRPAIVDAFLAQGLPEALGLAIARQESAFKAGARTVTGGDARRGGSYGLCQMSLMTARDLGYLGPPEGLLNPQLNARLAAEHCKRLATVYKSFWPDVAAAYNSGRSLAYSPKTTRLTYVPNVMKYMAEFELSGKN